MATTTKTINLAGLLKTPKRDFTGRARATGYQANKGPAEINVSERNRSVGVTLAQKPVAQAAA